MLDVKKSSPTDRRLMSDEVWGLLKARHITTTSIAISFELFRIALNDLKIFTVELNFHRPMFL